MAGFREFVTGEVLTAANVDDFLAKQAVMKFADAAARDSALGTAVAGGNALREGMVAWLDDTDSVIAYDGSAWNPVGAEPPAGIGSNVVTNNFTDAFSTTSTSFTAVTDFEVTITPTNNNSKILLVVTMSTGSAEDPTLKPAMRIMRNSTAVGVGVGAGLTPVSTGLAPRPDYSFGNQEILNAAFHFLDSPASTSALTYSVEVKLASGTLSINRAFAGGLDAAHSAITAIEVAG